MFSYFHLARCAKERLLRKRFYKILVAKSMRVGMAIVYVAFHIPKHPVCIVVRKWIYASAYSKA